jgi:hypothetical protein
MMRAAGATTVQAPKISRGKRRRSEEEASPEAPPDNLGEAEATASTGI